LVLAVAVAVFQLTADTALAAAVSCVRAGRSDWRTALWLRRTDPDRGRGADCFWLYVGWGMCRTLVAGILLYMAFFGLFWLLAAAEGTSWQAPLWEISFAKMVGAAIAVGAALLMIAITCCLAFRGAWRGRRKLWLNSDVYRDYRANHWPPSSGRGNRAKPLTFALMGMTAVFLIPLGVVATGSGILLTYKQLAGELPSGDWGETLVLGAQGLGVVGLALVYMFGHLFTDRVLANSPED
jgi:hypothetical protein